MHKKYNTLKHNHGEKYMKVLYLLIMLILSLYLKKKTGTCYNNPGKSFTLKINEQSACVYFMHC